MSSKGLKPITTNMTSYYDVQARKSNKFCLSSMICCSNLMPMHLTKWPTQATHPQGHLEKKAACDEDLQVLTSSEISGQPHGHNRLRVHHRLTSCSEATAAGPLRLLGCLICSIAHALGSISSSVARDIAGLPGLALGLVLGLLPRVTRFCTAAGITRRLSA